MCSFRLDGLCLQHVDPLNRMSWLLISTGRQPNLGIHMIWTLFATLVKSRYIIISFFGVSTAPALTPLRILVNLPPSRTNWAVEFCYSWSKNNTNSLCWNEWMGMAYVYLFNISEIQTSSRYCDPWWWYHCIIGIVSLLEPAQSSTSTIWQKVCIFTNCRSKLIWIMLYL